MGDVGDYWREHKEYSRKQKMRRIGMDQHAQALKPFACRLCSRKFGSVDAVEQHERDTHGVAKP